MVFRWLVTPNKILTALPGDFALPAFPRSSIPDDFGDMPKSRIEVWECGGQPPHSKEKGPHVENGGLSL